MTAPPNPQSRSPSPAPAPHIPQSPLGPRAQALSRIFDASLNATLSRNTYANFAACFPTPAAAVPENLDGFWRSFNGRLGEVCRGQFEALLKERDVVRSLNALDTLLEEAGRRKEEAERTAAEGEVPVQIPVAPHTLPPETLHAAHLLPFLTSQKQTLTTHLDTTREENKQLAGEVAAQRTELVALLGALEGVVQDLEGAAAALGGSESSVRQEGLQGIEEEMADVDGVLAGTKR